jgi:hypothetical protein
MDPEDMVRINTMNRMRIPLIREPNDTISSTRSYDWSGASMLPEMEGAYKEFVELLKKDPRYRPPIFSREHARK